MPIIACKATMTARS